MLLEYGFCSALSMRSFVQYVQFLMNQSDNSTSQALPAGTTTGASHTNLMPYLYSSYSSLTKGQHADAHHSTHVHHPRLSAVPANTRDDLETSAFLALLFLAVFLLRSRGIKVSGGSIRRLSLKLNSLFLTRPLLIHENLSANHRSSELPKSEVGIKCNRLKPILDRLSIRK